MDESTFRRKLDELGSEYQRNIRLRNAESSPERKKAYQHQVLVIQGRIAALESQWEACKEQAYVKLRANWIMRADDIMIVEDPEYEVIETWDGDVRHIRRQPFEGVSTGEPEPDTLSWIDYHDRLVKEWFDGERELVDDLYPSVRTRSWVATNAHLHEVRQARNRYHIRDSLVPLVIALPITGVLVLLVWLAKMFFGF